MSLSIESLKLLFYGRIVAHTSGHTYTILENLSALQLVHMRLRIVPVESCPLKEKEDATAPSAAFTYEYYIVHNNKSADQNDLQ